MDSRYARAPEALFRRSLGAVLVRLPAGSLRTLPGTAAEIWDLLSTEPTLAQIVADMAGRYESAAATIEADVVRLVETLIVEGLVVPIATSPSQAPVA